MKFSDKIVLKIRMYINNNIITNYYEDHVVIFDMQEQIDNALYVETFKAFSINMLADLEDIIEEVTNEYLSDI